jgi:hypothetical protein
VSRDSLVRDDPHFRSYLINDPDYFGSLTPRLEFFVYAGRRSKIDATAATHNTWSRLLGKNGDEISIITYDSILDAFLARGY